MVVAVVAMVLTLVEIAVVVEIIVLVTVEYGLVPPEPTTNKPAALTPVPGLKDDPVFTLKEHALEAG